METIGTWWLWLGFFILVLAMLGVDLFMSRGGRSATVSIRSAAIWSAVWVVVALSFAAALWGYLDADQGRAIANEKTFAFLTGYLVEKSLAIDNVFVWMMIFSYFSVPLDLQRRVLMYGILGAIVLRTVMIFAGSWLISEFHWIIYLFGAFLVVTGIKMAWFANHDADLAKNPLIRWIKRAYPVSERLHGERFLTVERGVRTATPLLLALVLIELSDVIFAVDSIPAIFAITADPFIVLTSNLFAILGLRAMYFLLADLGDRFSLLKYGLAAILVLIGAKMIAGGWIKFPIWLSLGLVVAILAVTMIASVFHRKYAR